MPETFEIDRCQLDRLITAVKTHGAEVEEEWEEPQGARFIGTFEGHLIRLFPKYDRNFALYFTVAHLYGHMTQLCRPKSPEMLRATELVKTSIGTVLTQRDVQAIYEHEIEAAKIGRALMTEAGPISQQLDQQYSRMFFADFHYLVNFMETKVAGIEPFEHYLRREAIPWKLIDPDPRPLVDLAHFAVLDGSAVVV